MSRVFKHLKSTARIVEFDDHVHFEDYVVVDKITKRAEDFPINGNTGELLTDEELPDQFEIGNHRYFKDGRPVFGSVTAAAKKFFPGFDALGQSTRISQRNGILFDHTDKYYRVGHDQMCKQWPALRASVPDEELVLFQHANEHFEDLGRCNPRGFTLFRKLYMPVAQRALIKLWDDNRDQAGESGTAFHLLVQRFYENELDLAEAACDTVEFKQFLDFHEQWVQPRGLKMLLTEQSMFDEYTGLAGTIDAVFVEPGQQKVLAELRSGATKFSAPLRIVVADWKRSDKIENFPTRPPRTGEPPFDDWPDGKVSERWYQLMAYSHVLETNTRGRFKVTSAHAICFHPKLKTYNVSDVPFADENARYTPLERMTRLFEYLREKKLADLTEERNKVLAEVNRCTDYSALALVTADAQDTAAAHQQVGNLIRLVDIEAQLAEMAAAGEKAGGKRKK